jgi:hypothetical protein
VLHTEARCHTSKAESARRALAEYEPGRAVGALPAPSNAPASAASIAACATSSTPAVWSPATLWPLSLPTPSWWIAPVRRGFGQGRMLIARLGHSAATPACQTTPRPATSSTMPACWPANPWSPAAPCAGKGS